MVNKHRSFSRAEVWFCWLYLHSANVQIFTQHRRSGRQRAPKALRKPSERRVTQVDYSKSIREKKERGESGTEDST
ncbi:unnamed protein product [Lota lota]